MERGGEENSEETGEKVRDLGKKRDRRRKSDTG